MDNLDEVTSAASAPRIPAAVIDVPDIRDYQRINAELTQLLDLGTRHVRLIGVECQRLLLARVTGTWSALIEIEGDSGPELAAELDAPGLLVVCQGSAADGAGSGLIDGKILILGDAGACTGVSQRGGCIVAASGSAERTGLNQAGGTLILLGSVGASVGERQAGGTLIFREQSLEGQPGRGRVGGRIIPLRDPVNYPDAKIVDEALRPFRPWLPKEHSAVSPVASILEQPEPR